MLVKNVIRFDSISDIPAAVALCWPLEREPPPSLQASVPLDVDLR